MEKVIPSPLDAVRKMDKSDLVLRKMDLTPEQLLILMLGKEDSSD